MGGNQHLPAVDSDLAGRVGVVRNSAHRQATSASEVLGADIRRAVAKAGEHAGAPAAPLDGERYEEQGQHVVEQEHRLHMRSLERTAGASVLEFVINCHHRKTLNLGNNHKMSSSNTNICRTDRKYQKSIYDLYL